VTLLCAVRESEQRRGSYESAAERLDKALRKRERAGDEAHASRDGWDGDEDWDDGEACGSDAGPRGWVTVQHMPLCLAPLGRSALTLPPGSYAAEAPLAEPGAHARHGRCGDPPLKTPPFPSCAGQFTAHGSLPAPCAPDDSGLGFDAPAGVAAHAAALCAVGDALGVSWDVFALGPVSTAIARAVATDTSSSSVPTRSAALVLVDRTCDLATPLAPSEALLEHVPQRCATGDVYTDALATALRLPPLAGVAGVTGAHGGAAAALEEVCGRRLREGGLAARKAVLEAMRREGMAPASKPKLGAVAPGELRALATQLRDGVPAPRHGAMVTHALAVADALDGAAAGEPHSAAMRALAAAAAEGGCAGAGAWLLRWLSTDPPPSGAALVHALLPVAYALAGDVAPDQDGGGLSQAAGRGGAFHVDRALVQGPFEPQVERAVRDALLRLHAATVGRAWVDARIARLHALAHARRSLRATPARAAAAAPPLHGPCHAVPHLVKALATRAVMKDDIPEVRHCLMHPLPCSSLTRPLSRLSSRTCRRRWAAC
jgi:hypothetical protein